MHRIAKVNDKVPPMSESGADVFELVFEGPADDLPETLRKIKAAFLADLEFEIADVQRVLENAPLSVLRSENEYEILTISSKLSAAGARVKILTPYKSDSSTSTEISTVDLDFDDFIIPPHAERESTPTSTYILDIGDDQFQDSDGTIQEEENHALGDVGSEDTESDVEALLLQLNSPLVPVKTSIPKLLETQPGPPNVKDEMFALTLKEPEDVSEEEYKPLYPNDIPIEEEQELTAVTDTTGLEPAPDYSEPISTPIAEPRRAIDDDSLTLEIEDGSDPVDYGASQPSLLAQRQSDIVLTPQASDDDTELELHKEEEEPEEHESIYKTADYSDQEYIITPDNQAPSHTQDEFYIHLDQGTQETNQELDAEKPDSQELNNKRPDQPIFAAKATDKLLQSLGERPSIRVPIAEARRSMQPEKRLIIPGALMFGGVALVALLLMSHSNNPAVTLISNTSTFKKTGNGDISGQLDKAIVLEGTLDETNISAKATCVIVPKVAGKCKVTIRTPAPPDLTPREIVEGTISRPWIRKIETGGIPIEAKNPGDKALKGEGVNRVFIDYNGDRTRVPGNHTSSLINNAETGGYTLMMSFSSKTPPQKTTEQITIEPELNGTHRFYVRASVNLKEKQGVDPATVLLGG